MRIVIFSIIAILLVPAAAAEPGEPLSLRIGETKVIALKANPSTGYQWRIDEAASEGMDRLRITDLGTAEPESERRVGAPTVHRWRLQPLLPGRARLELIYLRAWEKKPPKRRQVYDITVKH